MTNVTDEILSEMTKAIVDTVSPERVVLFGSRVDRETSAETDVDLLVVTNRRYQDNRSRWSEISKIRSALHGYRVPKDILLYSADEIARLRGEPEHVVTRSLAGGRTLYDRRRGNTQVSP
ncbi:MAG: nucleotidyltransferase [Candidatus Hydrogenedentota bacterium]